MSRLTILFIAMLLGGCIAPGAPIPVLGDRRQLQGEWEGTYHSERIGRTGAIWFRFGEGSDSASGKVFMTRSAAAPVGLNITYVWCGSDEVTGRLDPYPDPVTGERIYTMFEGKLKGSTLTGTYSTLYPDRGLLLEGTWSAMRKP